MSYTLTTPSSMTSIESPLRLSAIFRQLRPIHRSRRALLSTSAPRHLSSLPPTVPSTAQCPPSACSCADMPSGLAIDYEKQLSGTMPPYTQHVVIRTGKNDWSSKIEDEPEETNFARELKTLMNRGGKFHDPTRPIMVTNSNEPLPYNENALENQKFHAAQIYPQNISVSNIPRTREGHEQFAETFLSSPGQVEGMIGREKLQREPIPSASIYICGHNSRDTRCGILGPLLSHEFKKHVSHPALRTEDPLTLARQDDQHPQNPNLPEATVALISHIGGHAFAGNVVIYFPRTWQVMGGNGGKGEKSPLAGMGIWYGRVEPRHVWGIVEETVKRGRVVGQLCRGVLYA